MIYVRIESRIQLIPNISAMGPIVRRRRLRGVQVLAVRSDGSCGRVPCAQGVSAVSAVPFIDAFIGDFLVLDCACTVAAGGVNGCVEVAAEGFACSLEVVSILLGLRAWRVLGYLRGSFRRPCGSTRRVHCCQMCQSCLCGVLKLYRNSGSWLGFVGCDFR